MEENVADSLLANKYFMGIQEKLPRQGPGLDELTLKALEKVQKLSEIFVVLDVACGVGMQTCCLAKALPKAKIQAIDIHEPFIQKLKDKTKEPQFSNIVVEKVSMFEMGAKFPPDSFDLIWSEGALYIMGIEKALVEARKILKKKGFLVFSDLCYITKDPIPLEVSQYLKEEGAEVIHYEDSIKKMKELEYEVIDSFILPSEAWTKYYYDPMREEIKINREKNIEEKAQETYKMMEREIEMFQKFIKYASYVFFVLRK